MTPKQWQELWRTDPVSARAEELWNSFADKDTNPFSYYAARKMAQAEFDAGIIQATQEVQMYENHEVK